MNVRTSDTKPRPADDSYPIAEIVPRVRTSEGLWVWSGLALGLVCLVAAPGILPLSRIYLLTDVLIYALFAISYNILFGYSGLLSFGHSAYFGLGAYGVALVLRFFPDTPTLVALFCGVAAAMVGGLVIGFFAVRRGGPYFAMLTLAFGLMVYTVFWQWRGVTAGDDGFGGFVGSSLSLGGMELVDLADVREIYWFVLFTVSVCLVAVWVLLTKTPFGNSVAAVKQNAERAGFLGYNTFMIKLTTYVIAATVAGVAGSLFALFRNFISPSVMDLALSTDVVLMTFIGGTQSFLGPILGAAFYTIAGDYLAAFTDRWELIMGIIFIVLVLFEPRGLMGVASRLASFVRRRGRARYRGG